VTSASAACHSFAVARAVERGSRWSPLRSVLQIAATLRTLGHRDSRTSCSSPWIPAGDSLWQPHGNPAASKLSPTRPAYHFCFIEQGPAASTRRWPRGAQPAGLAGPCVGGLSQHGKVAFNAFLGISPFRYRQFFDKRKRKNAAGVARRWSSEEKLPVIDVLYPSYFRAEAVAVSVLTPALTFSAGGNVS
jgi:hypothetical protein